MSPETRLSLPIISVDSLDIVNLNLLLIKETLASILTELVSAKTSTGPFHTKVDTDPVPIDYPTNSILNPLYVFVTDQPPVLSS